MIDISPVCAGGKALAVLPGADKAQPRHYQRLAVVYVRQSTPQQVLHHRESQELQYRLVERAAALGWPADRIAVIDDDLGLTGTTAEGRQGFQRLLAEVGQDQVGLVLGIEMSRLARSCKDWYHLLEICALFGTLLADQEGIYDPCNYSDRLLLGLKGTLSEAELHMLQSRMQQGRLNKAARGELFSHPPAGYAMEVQGQMIMDPDEQAQGVIRLIFQKFEELGTINAVARYLRQQNLRLGLRPHYGPDRGRLVWRAGVRGTVRNLLRNPIYAGAYAYGRFKTDARRKVAGKRSSGRWESDISQWTVLLKDRLPAYITWEQYEKNLRKMSENQARATAAGAPRNGAALLGGIVRCPHCGGHMSVSYSGRRRSYRYSCDRNGLKSGGRGCQTVQGQVVDEVVARGVLQVLEPAALELSIQAAEAVHQERDQLDRHWKQQMQRVRYEAGLAQRRYEAVDPANRLVAQTLENGWESALSQCQQVEQDYQRFQQEQPGGLSEEQRRNILAMATDIAALWRADTTSPADRQQIVRLLVQEIVVDTHGGEEQITVSIRWQGGYESRHGACRSVWRFEQLHNFDQLLKRAAELRQNGNSSRCVAGILNAEGFRSPTVGRGFSADSVNQLLSRAGIFGPPSRRVSFAAALRRGECWLADLAARLHMPYVTLNSWIHRGWLKSRKVAEAGGMRAVQADEEHLLRLKQLCQHRREFPHRRPPAELLRLLADSPQPLGG